MFKTDKVSDFYFCSGWSSKNTLAGIILLAPSIVLSDGCVATIQNIIQLHPTG